MGEEKRTRLMFLGFQDEAGADSVLGTLKDGISSKQIDVEDWARVNKDMHGKVTITTDKSKDPGAKQGALAGGGFGALLAVLSGPLGIGVVAGGAAIGAATAAAKDSGMKTKDIEEVSKLMGDGRTGLMIAVPLASAERFDEFKTTHPTLDTTPDRKYQVDIVPGRTFERAIDEYRRDEEA